MADLYCLTVLQDLTGDACLAREGKNVAREKSLVTRWGNYVIFKVYFKLKYVTFNHRWPFTEYLKPNVQHFHVLGALQFCI